jgi:hypothetical protein
MSHQHQLLNEYPLLVADMVDVVDEALRLLSPPHKQLITLC